ncbi:hypothetical protein FQN60_013443, partial [Etheostoma spectabile]
MLPCHYSVVPPARVLHVRHSGARLLAACLSGPADSLSSTTDAPGLWSRSSYGTESLENDVDERAAGGGVSCSFRTVCGVSGRLRGLWVALIALVPLRPQQAVDNDTSLVQSLISGQHQTIQRLRCQELGRIKIHPWWRYTEEDSRSSGRLLEQLVNYASPLPATSHQRGERLSLLQRGERGSVERGGRDHNPGTTQKEEERGSSRGGRIIQSLHHVPPSLLVPFTPSPAPSKPSTFLPPFASKPPQVGLKAKTTLVLHRYADVFESMLYRQKGEGGENESESRGEREKETAKARERDREREREREDGNRKRGKNDSENQRALRLSLIADAGGNDSWKDMVQKVEKCCLTYSILLSPPLHVAATQLGAASHVICVHVDAWSVPTLPFCSTLTFSHSLQEPGFCITPALTSDPSQIKE